MPVPTPRPSSRSVLDEAGPKIGDSIRSSLDGIGPDVGKGINGAVDPEEWGRRAGAAINATVSAKVGVQFFGSPAMQRGGNGGRDLGLSEPGAGLSVPGGGM